MTDRLEDETRRIPASMLTDPPDFDVSDEPGLPGEFVDVASLIAEVRRLRATIEAVAEALAGDGQAVLRVAAAQQVLIDAARQEQP